MQHDTGMLRDYLVAGVEDPRINLQSILSRHFLVRALAAARCGTLMEAECRFAAAMNWLTGLAGRLHDVEELELILYALRRGADNAEGIEIPRFIVQTFAALPTDAGSLTIPNYVESFLSDTQMPSGHPRLHEPSLNTFRDLWNQALSQETSLSSSSSRPPLPDAGRDAFHRVPVISESWGRGGTRPYQVDGGKAQIRSGHAVSVVEPACGSANDYRFLHAYGLGRLVRYTGFDLCAKNIENARALFPNVPFAVDNVFEIAAPDKAYDLCIVHDLFEHLSLDGMQAAVKEVCRVTRQGLCVGFFNMDEIRDHQVRPVDEYHWNLLSMGRMKELFAASGFAAQVVHIGTFLRQQIGCEQTHNPNAYTFLLHPLKFKQFTATSDGHRGAQI
jgi:ubiquinone/menaquinone biosynthesis C-methylase UbiE